MAELSGGRLAVRALKREGVDVIFSLNGGHIAPIFDACLDEGLRIVDVRHEEAAGHMAHAYARITGRIGVAAVSAGPGVTNLVTAVANAYQAGVPLLAIGGKAPLKQFELGALQDLPQVELMAPITKWSRTILETSRIPEYFGIACREAFANRPGPVFLEIPTDVLRARVECADSEVPRDGRAVMRAQGDPAAIARAIDLLRRARRPLVLAGSGVLSSGACAELRRFVESAGLPVLTTSVAKGCVPAAHPLHLAGARSAALSQADVILVIGTRFNFVMGYGRPPRFHPGVKVIQVDVDPAELGRNRPLEVAILGDARLVLEQLANVRAGDISEWLAMLRRKHAEATARLDAASESNASPIHPLRLCREIQSLVDDQTTVVADGGDILSFARVGLAVNAPCHWLEPGVFGCLGVGVPFAVAAKVARPAGKVVCLTGDGAFGLTGMEMDTAVRHKLSIVVVISNNAAWGIERTSQIEDFGPDRIVGTELNPTRYDLMVQALGGYGELVEDAAQIKPAIERAFASGLPACINVITDRSARSPDSVRGLARVPDDQPLGWKA